MVMFIRRRGKFIRRFLEDVWGTRFWFQRKRKDRTFKYLQRIATIKRRLWLFRKKRYIYQLRKKYIFKLPKRLKEKWVNLRYIKHFYLIAHNRMLNKYVTMARRVSNSEFIHQFLIYLEGRLIMFIYRSNFANNIFTIPAIINSAVFSVQGKVITWENYNTKFNDWLQLDPYEWVHFKKKLKRRINRRHIFKRVYSLYCSYLFFCAFYWCKLDAVHFKYPTKWKLHLDPLRVMELY